MSWSIKAFPESSSLLIKAYGCLNLDSVMEMAASAASKAFRHACDNYLFDFTDLTLETSKEEIAEKPPFSENADLSIFRIAVACSFKNKPECNLLQEVANKQGYRIQVFDDLEDALQWMLNDNNAIEQKT